MDEYIDPDVVFVTRARPHLTLTVNKKTGAAELNGEPLEMRPCARELLQVFARYPDRMMTTQQIAQELWGMNNDSSCALVRSYLALLRESFGDAACLIRGMRNSGYCFDTF